MKLVFQTLCVALFLVSCQKTLTHEKDITTAVVASDANSPLKSHSLTFTSDYPVKPGEVPPFSFTKTQYQDARIKTIRMLSRKNPIYPGFKKEAVELIGTFTYAAAPAETNVEGYPHRAFLKGTCEVWEYYKTATGAGARRSISKKNVNWKFYINSGGYCGKITDIDRSIYSGGESSEFEAFYIHYGGPTYSIPASFLINDNPITQEGTPWRHMFTKLDEFGNILSFYPGWGGDGSVTTYAYDYNIPRGSKNYSFIPSQNLICQEYSLLEVMQWVPQPTHQRKAAAGVFKLQDGTLVTQSQVYKNYQFDANGNQTSLTYGDNILQKTTWHVQP